MGKALNCGHVILPNLRGLLDQFQIRILFLTLYWRLIDQGDNNIVNVESSAKPAFIAEGIHFSIIAIVSLVGLVGALGRKRGLVSFYSAFLWGSLIVNAALG